MALNHITTGKRRREIKTDSITSQFCKSCQTSKPLDAFPKSRQFRNPRSNTRNGRTYTCKDCVKAQDHHTVKEQCCRQCKTPIPPQARQCPDCLRGQNARQLRLFKSRRQQGLCIHCGKTAPADGRYSCQKCLDRMKARVRKLHRQRIEEGLCHRCGKRRATEFTVNCADCYFKQAARINLRSSSHWQILKDKWYKQEGACPYSGELMVLGKTASIDHVKPRSRFPQDATNPDNVEWVHERVNHMKRDLTKEEFVALIEKIIAHTKG